MSAGHNNGELVDNLCYEDYIRTPEVERVSIKSTYKMGHPSLNQPVTMPLLKVR